ncbi:MAG TPA: aldehyde ferredoxin oxidoreductase N-terminal domain-containing protein [Spirochaetia bacterium]|nr:aldehyde ferredoxin oxidoreductase N-terminal domain-containing protein [Spirochaetales bacterium]HRY79649.1 aldehyde ferredoxin oxidoreductase N-terminal domain-containing protein [Spirochaetia bacterium]
MEAVQRVLFVDPSTGFYRLRRYKVGDYFGPVDLGLHITDRWRSLNIGVGIFAGSILPGSNRLIVNGFSPCWRGFYVSSMGGAGVAFDNLGINLISIVGKAPVPSILYLNRSHGEEIDVEVIPVDLAEAWSHGRGGLYGLMELVLDKYGNRYETDPRVLATGPAARSTDFGAVGSAPVVKGKLTYVDTWAGRGGFGSNMLQEHGLAAVVFGGTFLDEDFRDRKVADEWFEQKYKQKLAAKDFESTTKYRFDPKFETGGTFGVNYATLKGRVMAFNYRTIFDSEDARLDLHKRLILDHYLKQFNEETIQPRKQATCGEPCAAVCKKMNGEFKKDYEPYQTMGPLCGVFDQRAAERLNHKADAAGFDGISLGGVLAWFMDLLDRGELAGADLGVSGEPKFDAAGFDPVADSAANADLAEGLIDTILEKRGIVDLSEGVRKFARKAAKERGVRILNSFVHTANGRRGWMVPNQYWTPGALAPMAIMGKYYMHYGPEFLPPRKLGRTCAERLKKELVMDNLGVCRFHRGWSEEMLPEIMESLYGNRDRFLAATAVCASRINSRNASVYWESERNLDFVVSFLKRRRDVEGDADPELARWIDEFDKDRKEAGLSFWYEMKKGIDESLREFF